jgi:signal recognition particle receptor subunit beta
MELFNYATKEITIKIVYYGPGLSGKTTNLQHLHSALNPETKGKLLSLSTEADRTLFFDFLPVELGKIRDFSIRFQLYTVPGQVRYNATRKVVLKGADAVVFVADSQNEMREQNIESFANMRENLFSNNIDPDQLPVVLQYNKRDLKNIAPVEELDRDLNASHYPVVEASAVSGAGVEDTFKIITKLLIKDISRKHRIEIQPAEEKREPIQPPVRPAPLVGVPHREPETTVRTAVPAAPEDVKASRVAENRPTVGEVAGEVRESVPVREVAAVPQQKTDVLVDEIAKIHGILSELKNAVALMNDELKTLKAIREEQNSTKMAVSDIKDLIEGIKMKKRWFRF